MYQLVRYTAIILLIPGNFCQSGGRGKKSPSIMALGIQELGIDFQKVYGVIIHIIERKRKI